MSLLARLYAPPASREHDHHCLRRLADYRCGCPVAGEGAGVCAGCLPADIVIPTP